MIEQIEPKAMADTVAVYCAHDRIVDTDELIGNPRNPNKHPKEQINALAKIIKRQGWRHPIVVSNRSGFVVKGHGRLLAAKELGAKQVPVDYQDYESEASEYADLMADNKIQEFSELDMKMSADILQDIKDSGDIELEMSAFTEEALNELLAKSQEGEVKEDDFDINAELDKKAFVKKGDVWMLGRHRLMCGDSTNADEVKMLMDGNKANACITDPPYACEYKGGTGMTIMNDNLRGKEFYDFLLNAFKCAYDALADGGAIYIFHSDAEKVNFFNATVDSGFHYSTTCIWVKNALVIGRMDYQMRHEPVIYAFKDTAKHKFYGDRKQTTVWEFDKPSKSKIHPTSKPLPLIAYPMQMSSQENGIILDLFGGSGSTLMAAEQLNRIGYIMELDPKYASAIIRRYASYKRNTEDIYVFRNGVKIPCSEIYIPSEDDMSFKDASVYDVQKGKKKNE